MRRVRFVGLDVHKDTIVGAVADSATGAVETIGVLSSDYGAVRKALKKLGRADRIKVCYEAGPTGYGLYRKLEADGYSCVVAAPSKMRRAPGSRVKTDRRDAVNLALELRSGNLTAVAVPDPASEAIRDLVRARSDAKGAEKRAKQQLLAFLLRHDVVYEGKTNWTRDHSRWLARQKFEQEAQQLVFDDYRNAVEVAELRVERLTAEIKRNVEAWEHADVVRGIQALRGVALVNAATIVSEVFDFKRFRTAKQLMGFLGLCPSENTSGDRVRRGKITKAGNGHVRKALVEAAWQYLRKPRLSGELRRRNSLVSREVQQIAWKAQSRLHKKFRDLEARKVNRNLAVVAVARELAGFVWAIARGEGCGAEETGA